MSCDAPLSGPYCARWVERLLEPEALTLRHFLVHTVAHELLHVDGTLWHTLRLLFVLRQFAAKNERLTSDAARTRFHDRLAAFAQPVSFANVLLLAVTLHLGFRSGAASLSTPRSACMSSASSCCRA